MTTPKRRVRTWVWWAGGGLFLLLALWVVTDSEKRWQQFAAENGCKVIETSTPTVVYGDLNLVSPGKTVWRCPDGSIHRR